MTETDNPLLRSKLSHMETNEPISFGEPLDPNLPQVGAGCYTIWDRAGTYIYAGMAGRGLTAEEIAKARTESVYIHEELAYRWVATSDGSDAMQLEAVLVKEGLVGSTSAPQPTYDPIG